MSTLSDVYEAFFKALDAGGLGLDIVYPGISSSLSPPYLKINPLPAETVTLGVTSGAIVPGIMQVSVVYDSRAGIIQAVKTADAVIDLFARNTPLEENTTVISIDRQAWQSPPLQEPDMVMVPVSIPFYTIT
jgi:hypothetical protein